MQAFAFQLENSAVVLPQSTLPPPVLTYRTTERRWRLEEAYQYQDGSHLVTVPEDFMFDLASVPRPFWWLIAPFELSIVAPLIHDFLYRYGGSPPGAIQPLRVYSRKEADVLFKEIMKQEGVPAWRWRAGYTAVRRFGGAAWRD